MTSSVRRRLRVTGTVQGVGFRPYVYGLATRLGLVGFVLNDGRGVLIEIEGPSETVERFEESLAKEPPPLAAIEQVVAEDLPPGGDHSFTIRSSQTGDIRSAPVSVDVATCDECLAEISTPGMRRFGYAFTNCTNCGPRFTITKSIPYDRVNTTMAVFEMCDMCRAEYEDPADRRFHAQPIACPVCGPRLILIDRSGGPIEGDPVDAAARLLLDGDIVAIKGLGGYHLACDATNEAAVAELRHRKLREEKPFAVMVRDVAAAHKLVEMTPQEQGSLVSYRRPIVLLRRRAGAAVAGSVAPRNRYLGVMLAYTPLHHLLLARLDRPLVMTSGNLSDEPIAHLDDDARGRLSGVADAFLSHDRAIYIRCDDSVVRPVDGDAFVIRRSRGYAPEPVMVDPPFARPVLAAGPELKHTFCIGISGRAFVSHHIGDLENYEAMSAFVQGVDHFTRLLDVQPKIVAHDLHPDYLSTKWARSLADVELVGVQHHHAHIVSCMADNLRSDRVIGLALDGTGYGDDGNIWGCEVFDCDARGYERLYRLPYVPLPGAAAAIREPWRMAAVYLDLAFGPRAASLPLGVVRDTGDGWSPILQMAATGTNSPQASSAGRLFDAVAALCALRYRVSYEGQAAAELEQVADPSIEDAYPCPVRAGVIDGVALFRSAAEDLCAGADVPRVAAAFHNGLARALVEVCKQIRDERGLEVVALSGGTFQNVLLLKRVVAGLDSLGFDVLVHRRVPPNDGGIALGQAKVADAVGCAS